MYQCFQYKEKFHNCTCQNILFIVYQEEKKRAALVARANQADDEDLGWGDEDEGILSIFFLVFILSFSHTYTFHFL